MKQIILVAMAFVFATNMNMALACNHFGTLGSPSFDPMRLQFVPVSTFSSGGLTEQQFHAVLQKVQAVYDPIFQEQGATLEFPASNWGQSSVNGTVDRAGNVWKVLVYGGYARHPLATEDALLFLTCHEIGHHLGETNYYGGSYSWAAGEGQADYYSTLKCMRHMLQNEDNESAMKDVAVPLVVQTQCEQLYSNRNDQLICQRSAMAGYQMTQIWENGAGTFRFETPSAAVAAKTYHYHPASQCRVDTYFQGALCPVDANVRLSKADYRTGTCTLSENYTQGLRPVCWFNEADFATP